MTFSFVDRFAMTAQMVFARKLLAALLTRYLGFHVDGLHVPLHVFRQRESLAADVAVVDFARMIADHVGIESLAMRTFLAADLE